MKTVKHQQRKYSPEQKKRLAEMAVAFSKHMRPFYDAVSKNAEFYAKQREVSN